MIIKICLYNFLFFGTAIVFNSFIPLFFQDKGLSTTEIGLLMGTGPLIALIAQPFFGYLSDKNKTMKTVLIVTFTGAILTSAGLFTADNFLPLFFFVLLFMFFFTPTGPLTESFSMTFAKSRGRNYGKIRLWGSMGAAVMVFVYGYFINLWGIHNLYFMWLPMIILVTFTMGTMQDASRETPDVSKETAKKMLQNRLFLWFLFLVLVIAIPHRMNDSMLGLYMVELGATEAQVGWAWTVAFISEIPVFAFMIVLMRKYHELSLISIAACLYALRWMVYSFTDSPEVIMFMQASNSVTFALFFLASIHYLSVIVPEEMRATGMASFGVVYGGFGGVIGSSVGGWVMDEYGAQTVYMAGSMLALTGALACGLTQIYLQRKYRSSIV